MTDRAYDDRLGPRLIDAIDALPVPPGPRTLPATRALARRFDPAGVIVLAAVAVVATLLTPVGRSVVGETSRLIQRPAATIAPEPTPGGSTPAPHPFDGAILQRVVLTPADMSSGLRPLSGATGYLALGNVIEGSEGVAIVSDPAFVDARSQGFDSSDAFYGSWAAVYTDPPGASAALKAFTHFFRFEWYQGELPRDPELGDEGFVFDTAIEAPRRPAVVYMWRDENMLMRVVAEGTFDPAVARTMAQTMERRAK